MKLHLIAIATIAAFASGIGVASAASNHAMANPSVPSAVQSTATDSLTLTRSQERMAWRVISKQATSQTSPASFIVSVGAAVPNDISLKSVPRTLAAHVASLKPYDYALLQGKLLIVNPNDKKIVDVINQHA